MVASLALLVTSPFVAVKAGTQNSMDAERKVEARVTPRHPHLARAMNIQGKVRGDVLVEPNGSEIGCSKGRPPAARAIGRGLRQWKWEPESRETHEIIELKFTP
jgi:hypothetical protein